MRDLTTRKGLFISYQKGSYFAPHWVDYLVSLGFDHLSVDPRDKQGSYRLIEQMHQKKHYECLLMTAGLIPLKMHHIKSLQIPQKILFLTDDEWRFHETTRHYGQCFDWCVTTSKGSLPWYKEHGFQNVILSQWAYNHKVFRPVEIAREYDVSLIGAPHSNRVELVRYLVGHGIDVRLFGPGWGSIPDLKDRWGGYLSVEDMVLTICKTRINLNPARSSVGGSTQLKGSTFEIAGCRGFQLTEERPYLNDYFRLGEEIVTFTTFEDLLEKVRYYLEHDIERERIASKAYQRAQREHTWEKQLDKIFAQAAAGRAGGRNVSQTTDTKVGLVYLTSSTKSDLCTETIQSINAQTHSNFEVYLVGDEAQAKSFQAPVRKMGGIREALTALDCDYVAFVRDGDVWEPEKLQMQAFALDNDAREGIEVNLAGTGISIASRHEALRYSYRHAPDRSSNKQACYFIVPSSIMATGAKLQEHLDEFQSFLEEGMMSPQLQERLNVARQRFRYIELDYSLAVIPSKAVQAGDLKWKSEQYRDGWVRVSRSLNLIVQLALELRLSLILKMLFARLRKKMSLITVRTNV